MIGDEQLRLREQHEREAATAETAAKWIDAIGAAAGQLLDGRHGDRHGVVLALGFPADEKHSADPAIEWLSTWGDRDQVHRTVSAWVRLREEDAFGHEAATITDAFVSALTNYDSFESIGGPEVEWTPERVTALAGRMAEAERARARRATEAASQAAAKAEAIAWRLQHPKEPAAGLTEEQANLVLAVCEAVDQDGLLAPESRNQILGALGDLELGPMRQKLKPEKVRELGAEILVPWPLPGQGEPRSRRPLYQTRGPGRLSAEAELEEANVLVEGARYLKPLAEQVFAGASG